MTTFHSPTPFAWLLLVGCTFSQTPQISRRSAVELFDSARQRSIPVEVYTPSQAQRCATSQPCPVAIVSAGYGVSHTNYSFIATALNTAGYLVVSVQHELPSDAPLATEGDLFVGRTPVWQRGAANLRFVVQAMRRTHPQFNWRRPVLIGHSNGGDISAWLIRESPDFASALITLDNRRVPLPRASVPRVLSLRGVDFPADAGVIPNLEERQRYGSCIVTITSARHNDMHDGGPSAPKQAMTQAMVRFMRDGACGG